MSGASSTSFWVRYCSNPSTTIINFTVSMPSKVITLLFLTWKTPLRGVNSVSYNLLSNVCFEEPEYSFLTVDFRFSVVIDSAVGVLKTIAEFICSYSFSFLSLLLRWFFAMCRTAPHLKHLFSFLISHHSLSALFLRHSQAMSSALAQQKHFGDNFVGDFDVTNAILCVSLLLRRRISWTMSLATASL